MKLPKKLQKKIETRIVNDTLRTLKESDDLIDFSSNDYLGFSKNKFLQEKALEILQEHDIQRQGATGSRLLSGNHKLYTIAENTIASFHESETALIFNSGYDANIGFFQSVPQRGDVILYDEYIHASIRDGITMSHAKAYKFLHNDLEDLEKKLNSRKETITENDEIYIVTESVFSMDGDSPDLLAMQKLCNTYNARLIIDEAHATGVIGTCGQGLVQTVELQKQVFARIVTFGKALGTHGAAILCSNELRNYLINFARSLIYTTALPPHTVASIIASYIHLTPEKNQSHAAVEALQHTIDLFKRSLLSFQIKKDFISSDSAIHCMIVSGSSQAKMLSRKLKQHGYTVKPILSPTVPEGQERLRFCLHSKMTEEEMTSVLSLLEDYIYPSS